MKKISIFILSALLFAGCQNSSNKSSNSGQLSTIQMDSVKKTEVEDAKNKAIEQNKVIGGITFGITKKEFEKEKKKFFLETKYKPWTNSDIERNKIGEYKFDEIEPYFNEGKLYKVNIKGESVHYEDYKSDLTNQAYALKKMLTGQYGEPKFTDGVPNWASTEKGYYYRAYGWEIGDKEISMRVLNNGIYYKLDLNIVLKSIESEINMKESENKDSTAEEAKKVF